MEFSIGDFVRVFDNHNAEKLLSYWQEGYYVTAVHAAESMPTTIELEGLPGRFLASRFVHDSPSQGIATSGETLLAS